MKISGSQLATLCDIAGAAGDEIMHVYRGAPAARTKHDGSPVTQADLVADALIQRRLRQAFPGILVWSEELQPDVGASQSMFFLVDPLDGTKEFLKRNDEFTVNIALIEAGEPVAGVVLAPALGELFYAARGLGAWKRAGGTTTPLHVARTDPVGPLRVIGSRSHGGEALGAWLSSLQHDHVFTAAGSSLKFCRIAEGRADIYPRMGPTSQWDTAAGQAVLQEAGGVVLDPQGSPLRYGLDRPVLNSNFVALADPAITYPPV
jgi:3'(2'), 5'-bisphosphate nucleotidase